MDYNIRKAAPKDLKCLQDTAKHTKDKNGWEKSAVEYDEISGGNKFIFRKQKS